MKRLSIIIPMYNVEKYVERCVRSIEEQDIPKGEYEIICINDGSPDNSCEIIKKLQNEFNNIILINKENQGVSRARNDGIDSASGKYLLFIDPDDYVDSYSFGRILQRAEQQNTQVSFLGFTILNQNENIRDHIFNEDHTSRIYKGIEAYYIARGDGQNDPDRMWAILFKTEFLKHNNLRYLPDVPYLEDGELITRILCLSDRCIFDGHSFYQRTTRQGSATHSNLFYSNKATQGFILAARNLRDFQQEQNLNKKQKTFLNQPIVKFVLLAIHSSSGLKRFNKLTSTIDLLKSLSFMRVKIEGCNKMFRFFGNLYNISPYLSAVALITYPRLKHLVRALFE